MADDLIASNALIGKTPAEVVQLLGEPDAPAFHAEYWNMTFALGPCRHMVGIDSEFLALRLDARGTVSQAAIVED